MSELLVGLLCWLGAALLSSLLIGRFLRLNDADDSESAIQSITGLSMLPGYGWEDARGTENVAHSETSDENVMRGTVSRPRLDRATAHRTTLDA